MWPLHPARELLGEIRCVVFFSDLHNSEGADEFPEKSAVVGVQVTREGCEDQDQNTSAQEDMLIILR